MKYFFIIKLKKKTVIAEKTTSLKKCPPSAILIRPRRNPNIIDKYTYFKLFETKYNTINENPTAASPETKEQFDVHASLI